MAATKDQSGFEFIRWFPELSGGQNEILDGLVNPSEAFDSAELISFITSVGNNLYGKKPAERRKNNSVKKIRFYPENKAAYKEALVLYRRSYNLAAERFLNDSYLDENGKFINMRPAIKAQVYQEQKDKGHAYNSIISDNGTLAEATTFRAVCAKNKKLKNKKGEKESSSDIHFKSRKGSRHSFSIDRLPSGLNPCLASLGRIHLTEEVPEEAIGKTCVITYDKGRWFIQVQQHIELNTDIQGAVKCVGIDPGVRTFATCFSEKEAVIAGYNVAKEKLFPLMKQVDALRGQKQKLLNTQKGVKFLAKQPVSQIYSSTRKSGESSARCSFKTALWLADIGNT